MDVKGTPTTPKEKDQDIDISLPDLLRFLLRGLIPAFALAAVAGASVYFLQSREPTVFRAEATLLITRPSEDLGRFGLSPVTAPAIEMGAYEVAAESDRVLTEALQRLGLESSTASDVRRLRGQVDVFIEGDPRNSGLLGIEAFGEEAETATTRADAVAESLVAWDRRRARESLSRVITTLEQQIAALGEQIRSLQALGDASSLSQADGLIRLRAEQQQQLAYARALIASAEGRASVLQGAGTTPRKVAPRPLLSALVAAVLAAVLAYVVLLLRRAFDTQLRGSDDVAATSGLPVLAEVPRVGREGVAKLREASSYLRTNLMFSTAEAYPKVFLVTSARDGEGKTTTARQLSESLVRNGHRTLLVDADLRSPSVAASYGISEADLDITTTSEWVVAPEEGRARLKLSLPEGGDLHVIPQFQPSVRAAESLSRGFREALKRWEQEYDVIVIDTAPVLAVADTLSIAPFCTGTVLVVDPQASDRRQLSSAVGLLERVGVRMLGVVVNNTSASSASTVGYGYGSDAPKRPRTAGEATRAASRPR